jgi:hypothetical protein
MKDVQCSLHTPQWHVFDPPFFFCSFCAFLFLFSLLCSPFFNDTSPHALSRCGTYPPTHLTCRYGGGAGGQGIGIHVGAMDWGADHSAWRVEVTCVETITPARFTGSSGAGGSSGSSGGNDTVPYVADLAVTVSSVDGVPKVWTTSRTSEEFVQLHEHLAPMADTPLPHPPWTDRASRGWSMLRDMVSSRTSRVPTPQDLNEYVAYFPRPHTARLCVFCSHPTPLHSAHLRVLHPMICITCSLLWTCN